MQQASRRQYRARCRLGAAATALAAVAGLLGAPGPAGAATSAPDFYTPPASLPAGKPGDLIRTEPSPLGLPLPAKATRLMYRSTDVHGAPIAVTGTMLAPTAAWRGSGPRPLVSLAIGTHGQGDQCAPSKLLNTAVHYRPPFDLMAGYEVLAMSSLLSRGYAVVVTDYQGLGTPGTHAYLNPVAEGHAVIDAARAAQRLPGTPAPAGGPVAFWGYSQGGGAAGGAAEAAGAYAPELDLRGSYVGAAPTDLAALSDKLSGTLLSGVLGYYLNGLVAAYPHAAPIIQSGLNRAGKAMLQRVAGQCVVETALDYGFHRSGDFTAHGEPITAMLNANPETRAILASHRLGAIPPSAPVLMSTGDNDDIVPASAVRATAADWCRRGATVRVDNLQLPAVLPGTALGHIANYLAATPAALDWLAGRFAGSPAPSTC
ncbi:lipase family protein [Amycolatopsis sp. FU40]|uniref:lipase family protein n=1 Tax=Amycolatopsis sp. FU40 TaxID=2914159 RepID=UPI001F1E3749|nr:lipase family protein [Amycolatopsis sp. FU40]UKD52743.1 lipase family protein [Amycolatopsis sp. FU40]